MAISERQKREKEARKELILSSAIKTFTELGYHNASMDLIAEVAELGKSTLYYYYKSKKELLAAVLEKGIVDFFNMLEYEWQHIDDPIQKIKLVTITAAHFFSTNKDYFRFYTYLSSHPYLRKNLTENYRLFLSKKLNLIDSQFKEAMRKNLIKPFNRKELLEIFGSLVMGIGVLSDKNVSKKSLLRKAKMINDIFLKGILKPGVGK